MSILGRTPSHHSRGSRFKFQLDLAHIRQAKEKLLQSALTLIYSRSYSDVGVQEVCDHAGVKKGSFYHFFSSKRELAVAMLDRANDMVHTSICDQAFDRKYPPLRRLEKWMDLLYSHAKKTQTECGHVLGCPVGNLACELSTFDEILQSKTIELFYGLQSQIEAILREAIHTGAIPKQDVVQTASALIAYMQGVHVMAKVHNNSLLIKSLGGTYLKHLIGARGPESGRPGKVVGSNNSYAPR